MSDSHGVGMFSLLGMMADPIGELNMVFEICGIVDAGTCTNIINQEGFTSLVDLGVLETDMDVLEMAKTVFGAVLTNF
jgi:hypothetical protein